MPMNPDAPLNNRFAIMIILGDLILPHQTTFWLDELLKRLTWLNIPERTARSTLNRMTKDGWFNKTKIGRRNHYNLSTWGENILKQGDLRILEQKTQHWDEQWHLVTYSLPDNKRTLRHKLVEQLTWLGYGRISRGTWLSPYNRRDTLQQALKDPSTKDYLHFFSGTYLGNTEITQLIKTCWDFKTVSTKYQAFTKHYNERLINLKNKKQPLNPEESFCERFWLSYDFLPILRLDPDLPKRFLPNPWEGLHAKELYRDFKQLLPAEPFSK